MVVLLEFPAAAAATLNRKAGRDYVRPFQLLPHTVDVNTPITAGIKNTTQVLSTKNSNRLTIPDSARATAATRWAGVRWSGERSYWLLGGAG